MPKKDVLKVEFVKVFEDYYAFRVSYQNTEVLERGIFIDTALGVCSITLPDYIKVNDKEIVLFLQGIEEQDDNRVLLCTEEEKYLIERKVRQINSKYGIEDDWIPEQEDEYYCIHLYYVPEEIAKKCFKKIVEVMKEYRNKEV